MEKNNQLDAADRRLLRIVQSAADIGHAALAEQAGLSTASCWRRLKALEQAGILGPAVRLVPPERLGFNLDIICQVRMKSHDGDARRSFEEFVERRDEIMECYSMSGEWDYLLRIVATDVAHYEQLLMKGVLGHPAVATSASHFSLKRIKYKTSLPV